MNSIATSGQSIIISGGSRGLGLSFATAFLTAGNRVATFARRETPAVQSLETEYEGQFIFESLDALDQQSVAAFVRRVNESFGSIDALINNAAVGQDELLIHTPSDKIQTILATNVLAPILLTRLVIKRMLLQPGKGRIINITSICGSRGYAGLSAYSASKGALDAFTRAMARELGESGIAINSIAPGFFESEMSSVLLPSQMETIRRRTPLGKLTVEENVLALADMLLSADANIQGQTIFVDGGITV